MRILVTGGLGYLGGRLARYFSQDKNNTVTLGTRKKNAEITWSSSISAVPMRGNSKDELNDICQNVDVVIHCAGVNAAISARDEIEAYECNGILTGKLVEAAIVSGVKKFVYLSTIHVYGERSYTNIDETYCPINIHPYAASHRVGEEFVLRAYEKKRIDGIVVRISNAFGPPVHFEADCWQLFMNDLCFQALSSGKMCLKTNGQQTRDFITIYDVCKAINHLLTLSSRDLVGGIFNVVSGRKKKIAEMAYLLADRISGLKGFRPEVIFPARDEAVLAQDLSTYSNVKLSLTGFKFSGLHQEMCEIDQLIRFVSCSLSKNDILGFNAKTRN